MCFFIIRVNDGFVVVFGFVFIVVVVDVVLDVCICFVFKLEKMLCYFWEGLVDLEIGV